MLTGKTRASKYPAYNLQLTDHSECCTSAVLPVLKDGKVLYYYCSGCSLVFTNELRKDGKVWAYVKKEPQHENKSH